MLDAKNDKQTGYRSLGEGRVSFNARPLPHCGDVVPSTLGLQLSALLVLSLLRGCTSELLRARLNES
eukprot:5377269-Heterocapsa_arctica.AAC.1